MRCGQSKKGGAEARSGSLTHIHPSGRGGSRAAGAADMTPMRLVVRSCTAPPIRVLVNYLYDGGCSGQYWTQSSRGFA